MAEDDDGGQKATPKAFLGAEVTRSDDTLSSASTTCHSPVSSEGGVYPQELVENFALNLHRIDKDVQRCDRNLAFFTMANLERLRNVITTYVWDNLDVGYMQVRVFAYSPNS